MAITIYDVILGPVVSDKAYKLSKKLNQLRLKVHPHANKVLIAQALKELFNVEVEKVAVLVRKGKTKRIRNTNQKTVTNLRKHAIITLAEGSNLNLFEQSQVETATQEQAAKKA